MPTADNKLIIPQAIFRINNFTFKLNLLLVMGIINTAPNHPADKFMSSSENDERNMYIRFLIFPETAEFSFYPFLAIPHLNKFALRLGR